METTNQQARALNQPTADQTVAESVDKYGYNDAREAIRQTAQAMAIMQAVYLAVAAQGDGSVCYDDNKISRWWPAIDAAIARVHVVRDAMLNKASAPHAVDWWTSLTILEAAGAALWHTVGELHGDTALDSEQLQSIAEVAMDNLGVMYEELSSVADDLSGGAA
ncbi:MAG: hypothetical protein Q7V09_20840 [Hydrogenophaga sp.]|uniref:hypothetical protein n=1 Tax=Hydrogenophaga sp. TaxID=1904254 RepID=UPI002719B2E8|nr:hypothetical protein [Hydrogenophaga sp.]MDO9032882.1 hypothetical protein [Hydrogenophaga sp.]